MSTCVLSVSPLAKGLFQRAILSSGPCVGPWGPGNATYGQKVSKQLMDEVGVDSMKDLLLVPAKSVSWPGEVTINDADFGGYYLDGWVLPEKPEAYWQRGAINPKQIMLGSHSKDGTAALYDVVPKWNDSASEYQQRLLHLQRLCARCLAFGSVWLCSFLRLVEARI